MGSENDTLKREQVSNNTTIYKDYIYKLLNVYMYKLYC